MLQRSLFPESFELHELALRALDALDLEAAARWVAETRARDPGLPELASWSACIAWLRRELGAAPVADEMLAVAFLLVPEECRAGRLEPAAAERIDEVLARQALARLGRSRVFLDSEERVHRGVLLLVRGAAGEALEVLRATLAEREDRADLWLAFADACTACERADEANAAYVRALLLGAEAVDVHRLRHPHLCALLDDLRARHAEPEARELLLVHAWLADLLAIPAENAWLERHLSRLHLATRPGRALDPAARARRFALLFYLEASRPAGTWNEEGRDEMKALDPELFERVLARLKVLRAKETRRLAW